MSNFHDIGGDTSWYSGIIKDFPRLIPIKLVNVGTIIKMS